MPANNLTMGMGNNFMVYGVSFNKIFQWEITVNIKVDSSYWHQQGIDQLYLINGSFSIGHAEELMKCLNNKRQFITNPANTLICYGENYSVEEYATVSSDDDFDKSIISYNQHKKAILPYLQGKILLVEEILAFFNFLDTKIEVFDLTKYLQTGYLLKEIKLTSGVAYPNPHRKNSKISCNRCGSSEKVFIRECGICDDNCATCEECITLGRSKTCSPLVHFHSDENNNLKSPVNHNDLTYLNYVPSLTNHQREAAEKALSFFREGLNQEMLIWAVTGAGKTEIIFPVVHLALEKKNKVLIATPRRDVVIELSARIRIAFPDVSIVSLYGGSKEKWDKGDLFIATTHQVLRFKELFELVILDEGDAFPYNNQPILEYAVSRAGKKTGKLIYLTATPPKHWIDRAKRQDINLAVLPARYHGMPLPQPYLKLIPKNSSVLNKQNPHYLISDFVNKVRQLNGQAFIFLPYIKGVTEWTGKLKEWFGAGEFEGVYASDPNRDQKVEAFKKGKIRFLATTTIMERGITVPNIHVLVIYANSKIFDRAALIQIAGRVGRSAEYPEGLVWFLGEYYTKEMLNAKKQIKRMNKLALKQRKKLKK